MADKLVVTGARGPGMTEIARRTGAFDVLPTDSDEQVLDKFADAAVLRNPGFKGNPGDPGPADNTSPDKASLAASDTSRGVASLKQTSSQAGTRYYWTLGNFTGRTDVIVSTFGSGTPISVGAWLPQQAEGIAYKAPIATAPTRTVSDSISDVLTSRDAGAKADGVTNDRPAIEAALAVRKDLLFAPGETLLDDSGIEFQQPIWAYGLGHDSVVLIGQRGIRVGAVGGTDDQGDDRTDFRAITKFQGLTLKPKPGAVAPYSKTAISAQSTYPFHAQDNTFLDLGPGALDLKDQFYGYMIGQQFANSGITFYEVNNLSLLDVESRARDDADAGMSLFGNVGRYPIELTLSDLIKFFGGLVEGWSCPAILLRRARNTLFLSTWFEKLLVTDWVIKCEQAQGLDFVNAQIDLSINAGGAFIRVDNSKPSTDDPLAKTKLYVRISGGYLLLTSAAFGDMGPLVSVANAEKVEVAIGGLSFEGGNLYASRTVDFNVLSIALTSAEKHSFYSLPNAVLLRERNSWMPRSFNPDWNFGGASNAGFTASAGTVSITTADREFLTGTQAVKVAGMPAASVTTISRSTTGTMGPIGDGSGQTYIVFARVKLSRDASIKLDINGGFADFGEMVPVDLPAGDYRDIVYKSSVSRTQAQGRFFDPTIKIIVTTPTGAATDIIIDRFDYQIVDGDFII